MHRFSLVFLILSYFPAASAGTNNTQPAPAKLGACVGCHGKTGVALIKSYPNLGGQNAEYMVLALKAYQNGSRKNAQMQGVVGMLSDTDIRALAAYYAAQTPAKPAP